MQVMFYAGFCYKIVCENSSVSTHNRISIVYRSISDFTNNVIDGRQATPAITGFDTIFTITLNSHSLPFVIFRLFKSHLHKLIYYLVQMAVKHC